MTTFHPVFQFPLLTLTGWVSRRQQDVIDHLREENRVLREQLGGRLLRLTDNQRRRLAVKGKAPGRKLLGEIAGIVTPDTILRWYADWSPGSTTEPRVPWEGRTIWRGASACVPRAVRWA